MKLKVMMTIETPKVPNFFRTGDGQSVPICAVSDEGLRQVAAQWLEDLRANAARQAKNKKEQP